jgi:hypothetical protein
MIKRRHFLQFSASTVAALGLSNFDIIQQGNRYAQALGKSDSRKLALLVGINDYPKDKRSLSDLHGCVTDVDLQEELLVNRFGFIRNDIVRLTSKPSDKPPTRQNILTAFEEHLIKQANPGDVVVFHFSGHGSYFPDPYPILNCKTKKFDNQNSALIVADNPLGNMAPDIMGLTLFLLRLSLNTDNVTMVLDSCFSGGATRDNYRVRSGGSEGFIISEAEKQYQKDLMKTLQLTEDKLRELRCAGIGKGVVITAAKKSQEAADVDFDGFHTGAFTYMLTQYLWQQTDTVDAIVKQIGGSLGKRQEPIVDGTQNQPVYFINNESVPSSDAVIKQIDGDKFTLWLGGIDYLSLFGFQKGAKFAVINQKGQPSGTLELVSPRDGLKAEAKLISGNTNSLQVGTLLREISRVIPVDLKLGIGVNPSLGDVTAATQALSNINRVQSITAEKNNTSYSNAQYILSRMTADYLKLQKQDIEKLPQLGSIGLFTERLQLIPGSFGEPKETPIEAISRLQPKIQALVAAYIIRATSNANSSQLDVELIMNLAAPPNKVLAKSVTLLSQTNRKESSQKYPNRLPLKQLFQFQAINNTSKDIYFIILIIDSEGEIVFPYRNDFSEETTIIKTGKVKIVGEPDKLKLSAKSKGAAEVLAIFSHSPLTNAARTLQALAREQKAQQPSGDETPRGIEISSDRSVEIVGDLLDDLSRGGTSISAKELETAEIATLSIAFDVG